MDIKVVIFHLILTLHYGYGIYVYAFKLVAPPEVTIKRSAYGGHFKYLTFLNMLLQCSFFTFSLVNDLFGSNTQNFKRSSMLQKMRDFIFVTIVFSVGFFVSTSFWTLWHIDRELIFPKIFDTFFPRWLNHNIHTVPIFGVLFELWMVPHAYPNQYKGFLAVFTCILSYALWICFVAYKSNYWVYPILEALPVIGRTAFILGMAILAYVFYLIGERLNIYIWKPITAKRTKKQV